MLGASQWQVAPALRLASVGGVWLLSFLVVAVNVALAVLVAVRRARVPALAGLVATAAATSAAGSGHRAPTPTSGSRSPWCSPASSPGRTAPTGGSTARSG